jgi:hypothetical protein
VGRIDEPFLADYVAHSDDMELKRAAAISTQFSKSDLTKMEESARAAIESSIQKV